MPSSFGMSVTHDSNVAMRSRRAAADGPAGPATQTPTSSHTVAPSILMIGLRDGDARWGAVAPMLSRASGRVGGPPAAHGATGPKPALFPAKAVDNSDGVGEDPPHIHKGGIVASSSPTCAVKGDADA